MTRKNSTVDDTPSPFASTVDGTSAAPVRADGALPLVAVPDEYYEIQGEQGRGGIGVVLRALDRRLGRLVALKQLQSARLIAHERFEREMRITARLQHAGIAPVHEAGYFASGAPFYSMRLIEGGSLGARIAACASLDERLALLPQMLAAADTVAYAHSRRVIHRDLKPDNVVVGDYGEAVVIDWGLAKDLDVAEPESGGGEAVLDDTGLTSVGDVVGTPAYMPPEQARGEPVDERADVWSLGAMLYHLLAAAPPYEGASSAEVLGRVLREAPAPIATRQPGVPTELAAIVERAMARPPAARYPSAAELAADLRRFMTGQLVSAHRYSTAMLLARWARRHRAALAVAAVALAALGATAWVSVSRIVASQRLAEARANRLLLAEARRSVDEDPARAIALLASYPVGGEGWERVQALALAAGRAGLPQEGYAADGPAAVALSRDGRRLAVADRATLRVYDAGSGRPLERWPLAADEGTLPSWLAWLADGSLVLARSDGLLWLVEPGQAPARLAPGHGEVFDAASDASGTQLAVACADGSVWLWQRRTRQARTLGQHEGRVQAVAFAGPRVLSVGADGLLMMSDPGAGTSTSVRVAPGELTALGISADANHAAIGGASGEIWIVDVGAGTATPLGRKPEGTISIIGFARNDAAVVSLTANGQLVVRDLGSGDDTILLTDARFFTLAPDQSWLAAGRRAGQLELMHLPSSWRRAVAAHGGEVGWVAVDNHGHVASAGADGTARLWPASLVPARFVDAGEKIFNLAWVPGVDEWLVATGDGRVQLRGVDGSLVTSARPQAGPAGARYAGDTAPVLSLEPRAGTVVLLDTQLRELRRFSLGEPTSDVRQRKDRIACGHPSGAVTLLSASGAPSARFTVLAAGHGVRKLRWLDDDRLVVASDTGELVLLDASSGTSRHLVDLPAGVVNLGALAADRILINSDDGTLRSFTLGSVAPVELATCARKYRRMTEAREQGLFAWTCGGEARLVGDASKATLRLGEDVTLMDLSAKSGRLAAARTDRTLSVWDFRTGRVATLPVANQIVELQLDGSGDVVAVAIPGGNLLFWRVADHDLVPIEKRRLSAWLREIASHFALDPNAG